MYEIVIKISFYYHDLNFSLFHLRFYRKLDLHTKILLSSTNGMSWLLEWIQYTHFTFPYPTYFILLWDINICTLSTPEKSFSFVF